ncbi:hypothetical protein HMPREF9108_02288, partial [Leptotrichia sp. oral taxon 225 str. F0581]
AANPAPMARLRLLFDQLRNSSFRRQTVVVGQIKAPSVFKLKNLFC